MKKVLIAEDDRFIASAYRVKLTKAGYDVLVVGDGVEAIKNARDFKPDIIILDLVMPIKDGFATLVELKKDPLLASIPILVSSNLGQKEDINRAMKLGAADYVVKGNISISDMVAKIQQISP